MLNTMVENKLDTVDFGDIDVLTDSKKDLVKNVFESVSSKYDIMNDLMSLGVHRLWKNGFLDWMSPRPDQYLVDLAGGTGDIGFGFLQRGGNHVSIVDINTSMIEVAKKKLNSTLYSEKISWIVSNAENISLKDNIADVISISFGLRNVTDRIQALKEARRVLKPGGRFMCLEFSKVKPEIINILYDQWSSKVIPFLGQKISGDKESYNYLVESIRRFPDQESLTMMLRETGFSSVRVRNLSGGIAAIHSGWKY